MIREIREEELEHRERDTEITLGAGMLLAIGCGLILLCILCFSFGYSIGHRNSTDSAIASAVPTAVGTTKSQTAQFRNQTRSRGAGSGRTTSACSG